MKYFQYLSLEEEKDLFFSPPEQFDNRSDKELLAYSVGAALYMPATRQTIADDIVFGKHEGLVSMVIDLEDAIGDQEVRQAEDSLLQQLFRISSFITIGTLCRDKLPLIFIRVRDEEQLERMITRLEHHIELILGFVFPKFSPVNGGRFFEILQRYNRARGSGVPVLYGMPILEIAGILYKETRIDTLLAIKAILDGSKEYVLNVRIGATDFSSLFGLRRSPDMTIYDIATIRDCIADIINIFGRWDSHYVISGPVWEYFSSRERVIKPQLRQTPFEEVFGKQGRKLRQQYISKYVDGLIREVILDKENGIIGKTIIHPTHIKPVQCLYTVSHEEYLDAESIIGNTHGYLGVLKSEYSNKMNEIKPHLTWARRIMARSKIYGVLHEKQHFISLLQQSHQAYL